MKPILVRGRPLGEAGLPAVCVPLVARTAEALLAEAGAVAALAPDLIEWRVDFFEGLGRTDEVVALARALRERTALPLLFTRRSQREGGQPIALDEAQVAAVCAAVCEAGAAELVDWEMAGDAAGLARVRDAARSAGATLLLSFHDFGGTPSAQAMADRLRSGQALGADVAKLAVMPHSSADVLALLWATEASSRALDIPVVTMAMGALGAMSRVAGAAFGSAMSFGMGQAASAPGQWPVADLRQALRLQRRAMGPLPAPAGPASA